MIVTHWILAAFFAVMAVLDQRWLLRKAWSWQVRNPETYEPSDVAVAYSRGVAVVGAVACSVIAIVLTMGRGSPYEQTDLDELGGQAQSELSHAYAEDALPDLTTIRDWVSREAGDRVRVASAGTETEMQGAGSGMDRRVVAHYRLISAGDSQVQGCLTMSYDGGELVDAPFDITADYRVGPC